MAERGVEVDHATLNRWVVKFSPLIACEAQRRKSATGNSWRMDENYIKKLTRPMLGFKSFRSASATLKRIEVPHMIREHQFGKTNLSAFQKFAALAG